MYNFKITLKQHTPLIHFQHDQEGATLRASEVKPKLDRFILTKLGNGDYENGHSLPDILTISKLADIFEISVDELIGRA